MSRYNEETMSVYYKSLITSTLDETLHLFKQSRNNLIIETDTYINTNIVYIQGVDDNYIGAFR